MILPPSDLGKQWVLNVFFKFQWLLTHNSIIEQASVIANFNAFCRCIRAELFTPVALVIVEIMATGAYTPNHIHCNNETQSAVVFFRLYTLWEFSRKSTWFLIAAFLILKAVVWISLGFAVHDLEGELFLSYQSTHSSKKPLTCYLCSTWKHWFS